jgi:hypothetical protein
LGWGGGREGGKEGSSNPLLNVVNFVVSSLHVARHLALGSFAHVESLATAGCRWWGFGLDLGITVLAQVEARHGHPFVQPPIICVNKRPSDLQLRCSASVVAAVVVVVAKAMVVVVVVVVVVVAAAEAMVDREGGREREG